MVDLWIKYRFLIYGIVTTVILLTSLAVANAQPYMPAHIVIQWREGAVTESFPDEDEVALTLWRTQFNLSSTTHRIDRIFGIKIDGTMILSHLAFVPEIFSQGVVPADYRIGFIKAELSGQPVLIPIYKPK